MDVTPFGKKLKALREKAGMSQPQLARAAGLSAGYIGGIEAGHRGANPPRDTILTLARALDVAPNELLKAAGRETPADMGKALRQTFRQFVTSDPLLRSDEREMLIRLYESYVGERTRR